MLHSKSELLFSRDDVVEHQANACQRYAQSFTKMLINAILVIINFSVTVFQTENTFHKNITNNKDNFE